MTHEQTHSLLIPQTNLHLCVRTIAGKNKPTLVFLHGLASSMGGSKGTFLVNLALTHGFSLMRVDYRGHGDSEGLFTESTLSDWINDTLIALDHYTTGPLILIGSSIGAWVGLKVALARPKNILSFIGLAPAVDITKYLFNSLSDQQKHDLQQNGVCKRPSAYGPPLPITRAMIEDGNHHLLLGSSITLNCPVRLLHGQADQDVPFSFSLELAKSLTSQNVQTILLKDGDHRLSRPQDLAVLEQIILEVGR